MLVLERTEMIDCVKIGRRMFMEGKMQRYGEVKFLLDTGAETSVIRKKISGGQKE